MNATVLEPMAQGNVATTAQRVGVLLVDDHELVRDGLRMVVDGTDDLEVLAAVADAEQARQACVEKDADVAVVDLVLGEGGDGLELVKWIHAHHPTTRCVVASMHDERLYGERALRAGAYGYVSKSAPARTVLDAIRKARAGEMHFSSGLVDAMLRGAKGTAPRQRTAMEQLSDRELQVFRAIGQGLTSKEIAHQLNVSVSTIDTYRERLKGKLGLANAAELVHRATRWKLENA
jgi:DNA-binding NarL/FixJ family response regulator